MTDFYRWVKLDFLKIKLKASESDRFPLLVVSYGCALALNPVHYSGGIFKKDQNNIKQSRESSLQFMETHLIHFRSDLLILWRHERSNCSSCQT